MNNIEWKYSIFAGI